MRSLTEVNERGNEIYRDHAADTHPAFAVPRENYFEQCRYYYDQALKGWKQYDTHQDAHYFGVWVNVEKRMIFTYAEGDRTLVICPTEESYHAELADMARFYGDPPPAMVCLDSTGTITKVYDERPV